MLAALRMVQGAVSTKDFVPVLTHFHIYNGRIQGTNGKIAIDAALKLEGTGAGVTVPADKFLRAVDACDGRPTLSITEGGKLSIKKGGFKVLLALADHDSFPRQDKQGTAVEIKTKLLPIIRALRPFVSDDASRPWSLGIMLADGWAYATNNVSLCRVPFNLGGARPLTLPVLALDEMLRINQEPKATLVNETGVTFEFEDGSWLRSGLLQGLWPEVDDAVVWLL